MSHISDSKKSEAENRNLAVWKPLIKKDGSINYSFGRDYDKWFSDRFNCREQLFTLYVKTFVLPNRYPKFADKIWNKKENVFLYTIFGKMEQRLSVSDLKIKLEALKDFLDKRNIKLVLYLVPDREFLMNEEERYPLLKIKTDKIEQLISEVTDINIHFDIDTYKKEQTVNNLIYHTDHHLNEYGSYVVYKNICKELGVRPVSLDDYETIKSQKISESLFLQDIFFNGSLLKGFPVLNVRESLLDKYKHQKDIKVTAIPDVKLCYEVYNPLADSNEKIYIIHNSYGENILKFLQTNYKYMINRRYNWIGGSDFSNVPFLSDIEKYKPDTVLIIIDSYVLGQIMGLKLAD